ncbi:MAG TPA: aldehyde dehydrogenase family protein [Candidatus Thermoplasmatota archaeon]|jgi:1-pyrroline-5-carboxylate dehydrogenase|nr:aldehyde dehydrogenase family protein [Candidatus Thermoplasmatota archaeon]
MPFRNENTWLHHAQAGTLDEIHARYEAAVRDVRGKLGKRYALLIGGKDAQGQGTFDVRNPANRDELIGTFASASAAQVADAVEAAKAAFPAWQRTSWEHRAELFERAGKMVRDRKYELCAWMTLENGKNRAEALADVDEAIDFLFYYSEQLRVHQGYEQRMHESYPGERSVSVLRPYGVFAIVAPFNFPLAILVGMTTGATLTGNTAVVKPASATPAIAHQFFGILRDAGLPAGVANLVTGSGATVGDELVRHPDVKGMVFTGSRQVGLATSSAFVQKGMPGPVIAEMGGKNAVVVSDKADAAVAALGTCRAAFGFGGQKCSAASRAYVHQAVYEPFVAKLVEETRKLSLGQPEDKDTYLGPVIEARKVKEYEEAVALAKRDGEVLVGGQVRRDGPFAKGNFVEPTVIVDLPNDHELATRELFLPVLAVWKVRDLDEALREVNRPEYGLTGGIYSKDAAEVQRYCDEAEVGVVYANRARSATTGALVGGNPFVGWKHSGNTGRGAGGPWYLQQFLREQSRTVAG